VRPVSGKKLCKALERRGWTHTRTEGSHRIFNHPDSRLSVSVPVHGNRDVPIGTLKSIMRDAGLRESDL
jgi:predicted RNA binding protein YcfA (HicA-like mRNA interferase family)